MSSSIRVVAPDPGWQRAFESEAALLVEALGSPPVVVHHIGSTAIPGIVAKPVIDMLLEVERIERLDEQAAVMRGLGYEALGEFGLPGRRYFRKDDVNGTRTHQVHGYLSGSAEAVRHIAFRAYMVSHPEEAAAYGALKSRLAAQHPNDPAAYMDGKEPCIKVREQRAVEWFGRWRAAGDH